jgi:hypothetical protein
VALSKTAMSGVQYAISSRINPNRLYLKSVPIQKFEIYCQMAHRKCSQFQLTISVPSLVLWMFNISCTVQCFIAKSAKSDKQVLHRELSPPLCSFQNCWRTLV